MGQVVQDLRYGARIFGKAPASTAVALVALALGIGTSTAIFSVVDAVLLKPLPFQNAQQLVVIWEKSSTRNLQRMYVARGNFWEWSRQSHSFSAMAGLQVAQINLTGGPNGRMEPEELKAERVSAGLFPMLGVQAVVGRTFRPEEDQPGHANFAILSHRLWQRRFGADPSIAGKAIRLRDQSFTVVGVLRGGFSLLEPDIDVWVPLGLNPNDPRTANARTLRVVARLKPDVTIEQARSELATIGTRLEESNKALNAGYRPNVFPIREELAGKARQPLLILSGAVGLLLLITCANVASLLLARGASRRKEIAVRFAMGATRGRLVTQLLGESVLLSMAGGVLGLVIAWLGITLVRQFGPENMPQLKTVGMDGRLFLFFAAVSLATGIVFGILPAIQNSAVDLSGALGETSRGGTANRAGRRMRSALVVVEVALAVMVLIGAGLLVRSFARLRAVNPGFQPGGVFTMRLPLLGGRNAAMDKRTPFIHQAIESLSALPGVKSAAAVTSLPLTGLDVGSVFWVEGRPAPPPDQRPNLLLRSVSGSYFGTMEVPLVSGRTFSEADTQQSSPVAVVNQSLARRFFPGEAAVGKRLTLDSMSARVVEIVGICGDVNQEKVVGEDWPMAYLPYTQSPPASIVAVMRTAGEPESIAGAAREAIHRLDADQVVTEQRTMQDVMDRAVAEPRFDTTVLMFLAAVAFLLSAVGIYGVISYDVNDRIHELGIRAALGAQRGDVLRLVLGQGAQMAALGIVLGLAGALALTRFMASMLYGVKPTDFFTFAAISLLLGAVALIASYIPSRRAMALDPVAALRHE
jgi:putative ABC transport system permease protein